MPENDDLCFAVVEDPAIMAARQATDSLAGGKPHLFHIEFFWVNVLCLYFIILTNPLFRLVWHSSSFFYNSKVSVCHICNTYRSHSLQCTVAKACPGMVSLMAIYR